MTTNAGLEAPDIHSNAGDTRLWVERTGIRRYTGRSSRGAEVLIGSVEDEGVFTPGELLKIALAACSGLASDAKPLHAASAILSSSPGVNTPSSSTDPIRTSAPRELRPV